MKLGIKIAPGKNRYQDIEKTHAEFVEVWYNANKPDDYEDLFSYLKNYAPESGLHFWGAIDTGVLATLAYPDPDIIKQSIRLIEKTIEIAAQNTFSYVNIHPGTRALVTMDFETQACTLKSPPKKTGECEQIFLENADSISHFARENGVVLTIESVPPKTANRWLATGSRDTVIDLGELPLTTLLTAVDRGAWFTNDFGHTAANFDQSAPETIYPMLYDVSKKYASHTKLIHIGFLAPPYNGTDFHDSLDNPLLKTNATVPNNKQLVELLALYNDRDDVFALVEPHGNHIKNYFLAHALTTKAGKQGASGMSS